MFPTYPPGSYTTREYWNYDACQEVRWQAYNKAYFAVAQGRGHTLWPTPGKAVDMKAFRTWQKKFVKSSHAEAFTRGHGLAVGINKEDYPTNVWLWLFERMNAAEELKTT